MKMQVPFDFAQAGFRLRCRTLRSGWPSLLHVGAKKARLLIGMRASLRLSWNFGIFADQAPGIWGPCCGLAFIVMRLLFLYSSKIPLMKTLKASERRCSKS
jgi:hypothetical protein